MDTLSLSQYDASNSLGGKPGYNLTTDMAEDAIRYIKELNASAPDKPFFVYYVPGDAHSPHQPTKEWIDKFKGKFDMGWEKLRAQIFENQKKLGVIPPETQLTRGQTDRPNMVAQSFRSGTRSRLSKRSSMPIRPRFLQHTPLTQITRSDA